MSGVVRMATVVCLLPVVVCAGGTRDLADTWLVDALETTRLLSGTTAPQPTSRWLVECRHGRLYGLVDLPQVGLVVEMIQSGWRLGASWERLGRDLVQEDATSAWFERGSRWRAGVALQNNGLQVAGDPLHRHTQVVLRLAGPFLFDTRLDLRWPLQDPPAWYGTRGLQRWVQITGRQEWATWTLVLDRRGDGVPIIQGEVVVPADQRFALGLRFDNASGAVGLVTACALRRFVLRSSHLMHAELGLTHRWSLVVLP